MLQLRVVTSFASLISELSGHHVALPRQLFGWMDFTDWRPWMVSEKLVPVSNSKMLTYSYQIDLQIPIWQVGQARLEKCIILLVNREWKSRIWLLGIFLWQCFAFSLGATSGDTLHFLKWADSFPQHIPWVTQTSHSYSERCEVTETIMELSLQYRQYWTPHQILFGSMYVHLALVFADSVYSLFYS